MKISIICFSRAGEELSWSLEQCLKLNNEVKAYSKGSFTHNPIRESLGEWTRKHFDSSDAIIFICSCGIAVRAIAPFIKSKKTDPAVIVIDDQGRNVISLLSGHLGGANEFAIEVATEIGANPVVSTATDGIGKIAPDVFAKKNGLIIDSMIKAKHVAAAMVNGDEVKIYEDYEPREGYSIVVTPFETLAFDDEKTLWLLPRDIYIGIGCKKGTSCETIRDIVKEALAAAKVDERAIKAYASIDIKSGEEGLVSFAVKENLPIRFFSSGELETIEGDFTASKFVESITGVDNVCERSAFKAALIDDSSDEEPVIIGKKYGKNGVTVGIVRKKGRIIFE